MKQMSLGESGFKRTIKRTRKCEFLDEMNLVAPWAELVSLIAPHAPAPGTKGGRPPFAVQTMLRIHFPQQWFNLSDPVMEEALHDTPMFREFVGLLLKSGTGVDVTLIAAPSSTKNSSGERDPEMHQTKKGNQWHFGMNAHLCVDADSGLMHAGVGTAATVTDVTQAHALVHGEDADVFADAGYQGVGNREHAKASIRAKVEHPFRVIKRQFGHVKVRYRGVVKNTALLHTLLQEMRA